MFGNQGVLNRIIESKKEIEPIGNNSLLRTIEVVFDEQWGELARSYQFSEAPIITIPSLGSFKIRNSQLRKYIRNNIKSIRKLRRRLEEHRKSKKFEEDKSQTALVLKDLELKTKVAWKQLDAIRHHWISKKEVYEWKKSNKRTNSTIIDTNK